MRFAPLVGGGDADRPVPLECVCSLLPHLVLAEADVPFPLVATRFEAQRESPTSNTHACVWLRSSPAGQSCQLGELVPYSIGASLCDRIADELILATTWTEIVHVHGGTVLTAWTGHGRSACRSFLAYAA